MILNELHIAQWYAMTVSQCHTITGNNATIGVEAINAAATTGGNNDGFRLNNAGDTILNIKTDHTLRTAIMY